MGITEMEAILHTQLTAAEEETDRLRVALSHIARVDHWLDDDPAERVAYLQRVAREAVDG